MCYFRYPNAHFSTCFSDKTMGSERGLPIERTPVINKPQLLGGLDRADDDVCKPQAAAILRANLDPSKRAALLRIDGD